MKVTRCTVLLPVLLLCCGSLKAAPRRAHAEAPPQTSIRTNALAGKLKRLADALEDKNATVDSLSALVGPKKWDWEGTRYLAPTDPDFSEGEVEGDLEPKAEHMPFRKRKAALLTLTLAQGVVLAPDSLKAVFGRWRYDSSMESAVSAEEKGGPAEIIYSYRNTHAAFKVTVSAELTGPAHRKRNRIQSLEFERDQPYGGEQ